MHTFLRCIFNEVILMKGVFSCKMVNHFVCTETDIKIQTTTYAKIGTAALKHL